MGQHGKYRTLVKAALLCGLAFLPGTAAAAECRLALLLALDMSSSVDAREDALQRRGLARALVSEGVVAAALAVPGAPVALGVYEWSGRDQQAPILDWTLLEEAEDLDAAAARIAASTRVYTEFPTAMGYAIGHAATWFRDAPGCLFRTLDVSGDGISNDGFPPSLAYRNFPLGDVTVNGLVVTGHDPGVRTFYEAQVIRGPGAFVEIADGYDAFERTMARKLEREMGVRMLGAAE